MDGMTTTSPDVLAVARRLADDLLFPEAMRVDGLDVLPAAHLDALAAEGLLGFDGVLVPAERFAGQAPFHPAESLRPDRMRINGSLALGLVSRCTRLAIRRAR
jgi:hypothetical protein